MAQSERHSSKSNKGRKTLYAGALLLALLLCLLFSCTRQSKSDTDIRSATEVTTVEPDSPQTSQKTEVTVQTGPESEHTTEITEPDTIPETEPTEAETTASTGPSAQELEAKRIVKPEDVPDDYAELLRQYREVITMDQREFLTLYDVEVDLDLAVSVSRLEELYAKGELASVGEILDKELLSDRFPYVKGSVVSSAKRFQGDKGIDTAVYRYAYYNIDGSRSPELLIGTYNEYSDEYDILAIYTHSYDGPRLLQYVSDDNRWHLTIYTDGTYCVDGSGGANMHHWTYYRIHDSFDLDDIIAAFTVTYDTAQSAYLHEAAAGYEALFTPVENILWQPLFE